MACEFLIDPVESVHQFRKAIKRLRALVRLGRTEDRDNARNIDRMLRDTARLLSDARDAEVVRRTAIRLCGIDAVRSPSDFDFALSNNVPDAQLVEVVTGQLDEVCDELDEFISGIEWSEAKLRAAIELETRNMLRDMYRFSESGHDRHAHSWRKRVQRCANQLRLIEMLVPDLAAGQLGQLGAVAEILGDYNDLTILRQALKASGSLPHKKSNAKLRKTARKRQRRLRKLAIESGEPIGH
jgi:CHAD domain-containing protein